MANQYEFFAEFRDDRSSWRDLRCYPPTTICRNMLLFADFASRDPDRWRTLRLLLECPELSLREAASILGSTPSRIRRHAAAAELGGEVFRIRREPRTDRTELSLTARRALRLASFAAAEPLRWQLLRCAYRNSSLSQRRLAALFQIPQSRVSRLLKAPHLACPSDLQSPGNADAGCPTAPRRAL